MSGDPFLEIGDIVITNHMGQDFPAIVVVPMKTDLNGGQWATVHMHMVGFANPTTEKNLIVFPSKKDAYDSEYRPDERAYPKHPPVRELLAVLKDLFGGVTSEYGGITYELEKMLGEHTD